MLGNCGYFLSSVDFALEISAEWSVKQFGFSFVGPDLVPDCLRKKDSSVGETLRLLLTRCYDLNYE